MIVVDIDPGVCGLPSTARISSRDMQHATIEIQSQCPDIQALGEELGELDGYAEAFNKVGGSPLYELARKHCRHAACPVPMALVKGVEAAIGAALPKDVGVQIRKADDESRPGSPEE
jgi:hypothetical protein